MKVQTTDQIPLDASASDPATIDLEAGRRAFIKTLGLGAVGAALFAGGVTPASAQQLTDAAILNFALNFEYLGAEFYLRATTGAGLAASEVSGTGTLGNVSGGRRVPFASTLVRGFAAELAQDERGHVNTLRRALGSGAIARPAINLDTAFTAAARAAGLVPPTATFDVYANENNFLQGAFIFEDVCVTALIGGSGQLRDKANISTAAGFLAVESYQAGAIRTILLSRGFGVQANAISDARDSLDGATDLDQGILVGGAPNIVPADGSSLAFPRTPQQVLQIAYLNAAKQPGGFFPNGTNGSIR
ncbi:MAG: ferritin-like domain-containing protein [Methylorubrum rhodinum]|uniref:ferritin-like domain-containing protein n=1 Tax=Methylorubrum rhodinum TaxID=29428 RepID=UPI003BB007E3